MASPTYAVIGSTGNCGTSLTEVLLQSPGNKVHAYCRSTTKLQRKLPHIADEKRVEVFEGAISDVDLMKRCVRDCRAVFIVATTNTNLPGCTVSQDSARAIIDALQAIRKEAGGLAVKMPTLVVLSSATIDKHLSRKMPWWFHPVMVRAGAFVYDDLRAQEEFLREQEDWISTIFVKPGGLAVDKQRGHKLDFDNEESFISYLDLAAAMIEAADDPDGRYNMKNVSVVNTGGSAAFPKATPLCILYGVLRFYFPWAHPYLPTAGPG